MSYINLGILAHIDAGKTSLTERLLFDTGVIDTIGSVDAGSTQTDSLALERQRGITIKSAVVSFMIDDVTINLIDTPGHPDFIAEVERVLRVLDGAVLVLSAVEGVQAQTRVLMRALQRLRIPTLLFVNKIDRAGAQPEAVLEAITRRLSPAIVALGRTAGPGTRDAHFTPFGADNAAFADRLFDVLAANDDALLAAYVRDPAAVSYSRLRHELAAQTGRAQLHPVFFGSAITGAGVDQLTAGIRELLPRARCDGDGPLSGTVFKVERGAAGEKIAYARIFDGTLRVRERLPGRGDQGRITAISVFEHGAAVPSASVRAGQIARLWGLGEVRIGDALGGDHAADGRSFFAPPTLETIVVPASAAGNGALHVALTQLAEQDPLINLRRDELRQEILVSLYGEVQKEVIQATLAGEYGLEVEFRESTPICVERPSGSGEAVELLGKPPNPFLATVGLRVEPAPVDSGIDFRLDVELVTVPLYVYKSVDLFRAAMAETVRHTLSQGLYGWQVTDCIVTMTRSGYASPETGAGDFRKLTPLVLMSALQRAGTVVCEPLQHFSLELPADTFGAVAPALARLRGVPHNQSVQGASMLLEGAIPAARVHELQLLLPGLTRGEGVLETAFERYAPLRLPFPSRPRTDNNPLNRKEYLLHVVRRV